MLTVILTGGGSRRMGSDKALLPIQGSTMSGRLIEKFSALGEVAVSVDRSGRFPHTGAAELVDEYPGKGPLNGIISAFSQTDAPLVFLTATDLPNGEPDLAKYLADMLGGRDACVIKRKDGSPEPLFAVYARSCLCIARAAIEAGELSLAGLLRRIDARFVAEDELPEWSLSHILLNVNTPEEYRKAAFILSEKHS